MRKSAWGEGGYKIRSSVLLEIPLKDFFMSGCAVAPIIEISQTSHGILRDLLTYTGIHLSHMGDCDVLLGGLCF